MLKYLVIQLDDSSTSFCHYYNDRTKKNLIPLETLKKAIFWSMKENLTLQVLYPDYEIPSEYKEAISKTYHADIANSLCEDVELRDNADVVVFDSLSSINYFQFKSETSYIIRTELENLIEQGMLVDPILPKVDRFNIVITNPLSLTEDNQESYAQFLDRLSQKVAEEYKKQHNLQVNLLTDRMMLGCMNNCNAGEEVITLCPDGKFYICPAFYADGEAGYSVGNVDSGLDIKNPQLYRLDHAPICRKCDAWHCKRCVWLNRKTTLEVNTPSHEQCVMAHIERNASRELLSYIRTFGNYLPGKDIPELDYFDPFELIIKDN